MRAEGEFYQVQLAATQNLGVMTKLFGTPVLFDVASSIGIWTRSTNSFRSATPPISTVASTPALREVTENAASALHRVPLQHLGSGVGVGSEVLWI